MASLLIIGGSGFFGKSILDSYRRGLLRPWEIDSLIVLARNASILAQTNRDILNDKVHLINADISNCLTLPRADFVIHAAASSDAKNYLEMPERETINIQSGAFNYCNLARKYHQNSKILYVSSGAVYGQQPENIMAVPESFSVDADVIELPLNKRGYATAKRQSENSIIQLGSEGFSVSIARCFSFVGKYLPLNTHFAIGNFIKNAIDQSPITIHSNKIVYRSYMYCDDLIIWLMTILESSNKKCPIYNVGSDEKISLLSLGSMISRKTGQILVEPKEFDASKIDIYVPSIEKAKKELKLNLKFSLTEAIEKTLYELRKER